MLVNRNEKDIVIAYHTEGAPRWASLAAALSVRWVILSNNNFTMKTIRILLLLSAALLFCSCYMNTSGHLFAMGGYKATYQPEPQSSFVYQHGSDYYIELRRYRDPVTTHYNVFKDNEKTGLVDTEGVDLFQIDSAYAMYLTGAASSPSSPSSIKRINSRSEADEIIFESKKLPARRPIVSGHKERWTAGSAPFWYTIGVLDLLVVDMPITILENALGLWYIVAVEVRNAGLN